MNILEMLGSEHAEFRRKLDRLDADELGSAPPTFGKKDRRSQSADLRLLREFMEELQAHEDVERRIFFPALAKASDLGRESLHALEKDHSQLDIHLRHLKAELAQSQSRPTRRMIEILEHLLPHFRRHMLCEEQFVFPVAAKCFSAAQLEDLGRRAQALTAPVP